MLQIEIKKDFSFVSAAFLLNLYLKDEPTLIIR